MKVIDIKTLNHLIKGEPPLDKELSKKVSSSEILALMVDQSVQRQSQTHMLTEQAAEGTVGLGGVSEVDHMDE